MSFDQTRKSIRDLFPSPKHKEIVKLNPPPFYWLAAEDGSERVVQYKFEIRDKKNLILHSGVSEENLFLLNTALDTGTYSWNVWADGLERGWFDFEIPENCQLWVLPKAAEILEKVPCSHPRHIWVENNFETTIEEHADKVEILKRNVEIAFEDGLPPRPDFHYQLSGEKQRNEIVRFFKRNRQFIDRNLVACTFAAKFLGDEKALGFSKKALMEVCSWNPEGPCAVDGPWSDELGLSFSRCLFIVFDLLESSFDEIEKKFIVDTLIQYANQVYRRLIKTEFIKKSGHSHVGRISAYLGDAAIVLKGYVPPETSVKWLDYALKVHASFFPFYGGDEGGWAEGPFYASSYTKWYLPFFLVIEKYSDFSFLNKPFYKNFCHYLVHFMNQKQDVHPFGDGFWTYCIREEWQGFWAQDPFSIYARRFGDDSVLKMSRSLEKPKFFDLHLFDQFLPPEYLDFKTAEKVDIEQDRHFKDIGLISIRSDMNDSESSIGLQIRASRFGAGSHQHADQGGFALFKGGASFLCSSGTFGRFYGDDLHQNWTQTSKAHNVILIGGEGQKQNDPQAIPEVLVYTSKENSSYVKLNLTQTYAKCLSYSREFIFIREGVLLIKDSIKLTDPLSVQWQLHSMLPTRLDSIGATLHKGDEVLYVNSCSCSKMALETSLKKNYGLHESSKNHNIRKDQFHLTWEASQDREYEFQMIIGWDKKISTYSNDDFISMWERYC